MNFPQRVLIVSEDTILAMALEIALSQNGHTVRCEGDSYNAIGAMKQFGPDVLLTACETVVFVGSRNAKDISELERPVDIDNLLRLLKT